MSSQGQNLGLVPWQAFVTNSTDATVSVINTATRIVTQTINLAPIPMTFPFGIVVGKNDKKVFVTSGGAEFDGSDQNIAVLLTVVATIPTGPQSNEVAVTLDGGRGFITNQNGTPNDVTVFCIPE